MRRQEASPGAGFPGMDLTAEEDTFDPDGHFLSWKPGSEPVVEPDGMAWRAEPGMNLVLNVHLRPTGRPETVTPEIGLYLHGRASIEISDAHSARARWSDRYSGRREGLRDHRRFPGPDRGKRSGGLPSRSLPGRGCSRAMPRCPMERGKWLIRNSRLGPELAGSVSPEVPAAPSGGNGSLDALSLR